MSSSSDPPVGGWVGGSSLDSYLIFIYGIKNRWRSDRHVAAAAGGPASSRGRAAC